MKITSVECYLGTYELGGFVTVKVNTDEGIYGWGEAGLSYGKSSEAAWGQCQDFAKLVIGMDPFNTEEIWEHLHRHTFWGMGGGVVITSAMAAIDTACWDIKGKALGLPVYKLLGGKTNKNLRAYASQLQFGWRKIIQAKDSLDLLYDPKDYYDVVKDAVADGYDAVKIDPVFAPLKPKPFGEVFSTQGNQIRGCYREHDLKCSVERIAAAREAGGDDLDIIVEIHSLLDANTAAILKEAFDFFWVGFYEVKSREGEVPQLVLAPFQGPLACTRIHYGRGVCGTAWAERRTLVVPDVDRFPGHIACSSLSRSEIVVPVFHPVTGEVVAVLDIDSRELSTFDETDRHYLEILSSHLSHLWA